MTGEAESAMADSSVEPRNLANSRDLAALAREAMLERGLEPDFPPAAIAQAQRLRAPAADHIPDHRHLPWCSIDNDTSRDLDQLTVSELVGDGTVRILVAIADV